MSVIYLMLLILLGTWTTISDSGIPQFRADCDIDEDFCHVTIEDFEPPFMPKATEEEVIIKGEPKEPWQHLEKDPDVQNTLDHSTEVPTQSRNSRYTSKEYDAEATDHEFNGHTPLLFKERLVPTFLLCFLLFISIRYYVRRPASVKHVEGETSVVKPIVEECEALDYNKPVFLLDSKGRTKAAIIYQ